MSTKEVSTSYTQVFQLMHLAFSGPLMHVCNGTNIFRKQLFSNLDGFVDFYLFCANSFDYTKFIYHLYLIKL